MKTKICILLLVLASAGNSIAQENWTLIYENDANGKAIQGELADLISAIQRGEVIRIYFQMGRASTPEFFVEHTAEVKFTTIMNAPEGTFVTAQIDPIVGQTPDFSGKQVLLKENLEWSMIASTSGNNDTMTRNVITGEIVNHEVRQWGIKWFIQSE